MRTHTLMGFASLLSVALLGCACTDCESCKTATITAQTPPPAATPTVPSADVTPTASTTMTRVEKSEQEWKSRLSREQFRVLREKGTERAFTGEFWNTPPGSGEYRCAGCGSVLFRGSDKFVSECGWPAFDKAIKGTIQYHSDRTLGMIRTEVTCARCDGHLGHVFNDGPTDTGIRYCINSVSITYHPDADANKDAATEARDEAD